MQGQCEDIGKEGKVRVPEKYKTDFTHLKAKFIELVEEEAQQFSLDLAEKNRFKTMCIEYLNLILKVQRESCEYVDSEGSEDEDEEEGEMDELFDQKNSLLQRALAKKMEQCQKTAPSLMAIDLDVSKPEHMFVSRAGVETPIESELDFSALEAFPKKIQQLHERQLYYCNFYRELLSHQRWLSDQKI